MSNALKLVANHATSEANKSRQVVSCPACRGRRHILVANAKIECAACGEIHPLVEWEVRDA